jgi:hypothetical protein
MHASASGRSRVHESREKTVPLKSSRTVGPTLIVRTAVAGVNLSSSRERRCAFREADGVADLSISSVLFLSDVVVRHAS